MGMDQLLKSFLFSVDLDQKQNTVSLAFISWILSLFRPDNIQKPWNYHKDFKTQLQQEDRTMHLFQLKDMRFGLLSQSCAVFVITGMTSLISLKNMTILQISSCLPLSGCYGVNTHSHCCSNSGSFWHSLDFTIFCNNQR